MNSAVGAGDAALPSSKKFG